MHPLLVEWKTARLKRERDSARQQQLIDTWHRESAWLVRYDEQDEREYQTDRQPRSSAYTVYRGINRLLELYAKVFHEQAGVDRMTLYLEWKRKLDASYERDDMQQVVRPRQAHQWQREKRQDMQENFFHQEWLEQLSSTEPIRTYAAYTTYIAIKAVIQLLTNHKDALSALTSVHPDDTLLPTRESAIAFTQMEEYESNQNDPVWYISNALYHVPGVWEAAQTLQLYYSALVRAEWRLHEHEPTELPDDPTEASLPLQWELPESVRIEGACQAFTAEEGAADTIAALYGIGQKRFRRILRERGLMPGRGGNRRG